MAVSASSATAPAEEYVSVLSFSASVIILLMKKPQMARKGTKASITTVSRQSLMRATVNPPMNWQMNWMKRPIFSPVPSFTLSTLLKGDSIGEACSLLKEFCSKGTRGFGVEPGDVLSEDSGQEVPPHPVGHFLADQEET